MQPIFPNAFIAFFSSPERNRCRLSAFALALTAAIFLAQSVAGQVILSPAAAATNHTPTLAVPELAAPATNQLQDARALAQASEQIRSACIRGRRLICGKVLEIVPEGLVVESGYTNLLRPELSRSWVAPGNVTATRPADLVEQNIPDAICVGLVLVIDIPKKPAVNAYDYVILEAYPAGQYSYTPVPTVKKNIRRFSVGLVTAVQLNLNAGGK